MRFVPTLVHGIADYLVGLLTLSLPFVFGWTGAARVSLIVLGAGVVLYSLCTDYELSVVRFLRVRFHLVLDAIFGLLMLAAPWFLDLPRSERWPVYVIGGLALFFVAVTKVRAEGTAA